MRLFAGAVAIAEWLAEYGNIPLDTANEITVESFGVSAQTLLFYDLFY
jgi:hypothetical protein